MKWWASICPNVSWPKLSAEPELKACTASCFVYQQTREVQARSEVFRVHLQHGRQLGDRLKFVVRLTLTPNTVDVLWVRLPASLTFLYPDSACFDSFRYFSGSHKSAPSQDGERLSCSIQSGFAIQFESVRKTYILHRRSIL